LFEPGWLISPLHEVKNWGKEIVEWQVARVEQMDEEQMENEQRNDFAVEERSFKALLQQTIYSDILFRNVWRKSRTASQSLRK
jgi:hypothetical protein